MEKLAQREKEAEPAQIHYYEDMMRDVKERNERLAKGKRIIKGNSLPFQVGRQGILRHYCHDSMTDLAVEKWAIFVHEIRSHSGKHRHQGGLTIFVLKGKGYTVIDGVRNDWTEGDLICLPVKRGGVEHQHFNIDDRPSRWLAFVNHHIQELIGRFVQQKEVSPTWKGEGLSKPK